MAVGFLGVDALCSELRSSDEAVCGLLGDAESVGDGLVADVSSWAAAVSE